MSGIASQAGGSPWPTTSARIAELNDRFRKSPLSGHGRIVITASVDDLGPEFVARAIAAVAAFDQFTPDNDPHGEHDFGILTVADVAGLRPDSIKLYWKIDYYDAACHFGSEDPSDPSKTTRVMTILLPEDY